MNDVRKAPGGAMRNLRPAMRGLWLMVIALALTACGGGGSDAPPAAAATPVITAQPQPLTVTAGDTAAFSVTATATGGATPSYQWRRNGVVVVGAVAATYTLPLAGDADNGASFSVVVSSSGGSVTSSAATLTVNPVAITPAIAGQPGSQSVASGQAATFSVVATGSAPLSYQWLRGGLDISGATGAAYTTPATTLADDGATYSVVVSNSAGSVASATAVLTVTAAPSAPGITAQPLALSVNAGQTARFSVQVTGTQPMAFQWLRNGTAIPGATAADYTTPATVPGDDGTGFSVAVSNSAGSVTSQVAVLSVTPLQVAPSITSQPAAMTVAAGQSATFTVLATGSAPLSYQWRRNGSDISGASGPSYTTPGTTLADDGASYTVTVGNGAGSVTSAARLLHVTPVAGDAAGPRAITVTVGSTATFTTDSNGGVYRWMRNGVLIPGAESFSYTTPPTTLADDGTTYIVRFDLQNGLVSYRSALLTVTAAPVAPAITTQPVSVAVAAGGTASFSVAAIGTAPMTYQWQRNGVAVPGADGPAYTLANVAAADGGAQFSVTMSNSLGSVTSNLATLTLSRR